MPRIFALCLTLLLLSPSSEVFAQRRPVPLPAEAYSVSNDARSKASSSSSKKEEKKESDRPLPAAEVHNPVVWHNPGTIARLNLLEGAGGRAKRPVAPFTFEEEDKNGTNPKFDVRDAKGKKWRVKLGDEARPEVVASRLLWAVGYYVNEDYVLDADIQNLQIKRGKENAKGGHIKEARFSRRPSGQDKIGIWEWKQNPFTSTRELNGLRVMMAVMNNWDLKDENNSVYFDKSSKQQIFLVNDVGATFGTNGLSWSKARSKGNVDSFKESKFIQKLTDTEVSFSTPKQPNFAVGSLNPKSYAMRIGLDWIGNDIPRADARWIGSLLGQLTHKQLMDAFRAGHFPAEEINAYVDVVESRIAELRKL